ncbi:alpha/beta hydrolase [Hoyosella subflava]|uniref:Lysophospholipase n=1 Tax=Hoyosella subflava (strain DSM 45089 / JCM 17490 / NBRC 109087 / DQS3-9A1) TaxID=443218 RepID=F6EQI3_HOYSD|nr:alpha/beta fold hydrolase [Hoyosella subflava]AEF40668.1 Lysophospholipase [Hoyosella subflava DQS3-9A1]
MTNTKHVVIVHGTWGSGSFWVEARAAFEERGFVVHTPTLRHHELPLLAGSTQVATVSLTDYTDDLVELCESLDSPPLLVGASLGGLLVQLVAARTPHVGVVAACPAPAAGIFNLYPSMLRLFARHFAQPRPWAKPLFPEWEGWEWGCANTQPPEVARDMFAELVCESGRAYCEMALPWLDRRKAARVNFDAVKGPVLVVGGELDRVVVPAIGRATAKKYANATYIEIPASDHMVLFGAALPTTMGHIDRWMESNKIAARETSAEV